MTDLDRALDPVPPAAPAASLGTPAATSQRSATRGHDDRIDAAIAGALLVGFLISTALYRTAGIYEEPAPGWAVLLAAVASTAPLTLRRRHPIPVALVVSAAFIAAQASDVPELLISNITLFLAIYTVGARVANRSRASLARVVIIAAMLIWLFVALFLVATGEEELISQDAAPGLAMSPFVAYAMIAILTNVLYFGGAYYFGERAWASVEERVARETRERELAAARELTTAQAVALDRVRIARELHDVVAHHVAVMGVQAGAARSVLALDHAAAGRALGTIEQSAREAIDELHGLLSTLRSHDDELGDDEHPDTSAASIQQLPELVDRSTSAAGLPTTLTVVGDPRPVPAVISANLYRIAQEALTNARRHGASDTRAEVRLRYQTNAIEIEITNTGSVAQRPSSPGLGALGMRERAAASAGTLEAGPRPLGGWLVRCRIPLPGDGYAVMPSAAPVDTSRDESSV